MASPQDDRPIELRIKGRGWRDYANKFAIFLMGMAIAAFYWGGEVVVLLYGADYESWGFHRQVGIGAQLWAIIVGGVGIILGLGIPALEIIGAVISWRRWRQFRDPAAVVDADGVRFEARRPLSIPWPNIERLELERTIIKTGKRTKGRTVSALYVQVAPDAGVLKTTSPIPADRRLYVGRLEKHIILPYDNAIEMLKRIAGPRLDITEKWTRRTIQQERNSSR